MPIRLPVLLLIPLVACTFPAESSHPDAGDTDAGPVDAGPVFTVSPCPPALPAAGVACTNPLPPGVPLICEYSADPWSECASGAECNDGAWQVLSEQDAGCPRPASCPATFGTPANGTTCANPATDCDYGMQGRCRCDSCGNWKCAPWPQTNADCPIPPPLLGSVCTHEGAQCFYAGCCTGLVFGPNMACSEGLWMSQNLDCLCSTECS